MTRYKRGACRAAYGMGSRIKHLFFSFLLCVVILSTIVSCGGTKLHPACTPLPTEETDFFTDGRQSALLKSVSDGDTAWFEMGGREYKVRFLGIDTPEMGDGDRVDEAYAKEAKSYALQKLEQADSIFLERDSGSDAYDDYDRLLAWVWVDGALLNEILVEEGLATVRYIYGDYKYTGKLYAAQDRAIEAGKGVWGE